MSIVLKSIAFLLWINVYIYYSVLTVESKDVKRERKHNAITLQQSQTLTCTLAPGSNHGHRLLRIRLRWCFRSVCVCVCQSVSLSVCLFVPAITFEPVDIEASFLLWWYILTISRVKFKCQGHWVKVKVISWKMLIWPPEHQFNLVWLVWRVKVIPRSLVQGQGHFMENANFATWTSV